MFPDRLKVSTPDSQNAGIDLAPLFSYFYRIFMKKIIAFKFTILSGVLIIVALLLPSSSFRNAPSFIGIDKVVHFFLFLVFTLAYLLEFRRYSGKLPGYIHSVIFVLLFIVGSEVLQLLTPSRRFEMLDMLFDASGAAVALLAVMAERSLRKG